MSVAEAEEYSIGKIEFDHEFIANNIGHWYTKKENATKLSNLFATLKDKSKEKPLTTAEISEFIKAETEIIEDTTINSLAKFCTMIIPWLDKEPIDITAQKVTMLSHTPRKCIKSRIILFLPTSEQSKINENRRRSQELDKLFKEYEYSDNKQLFEENTQKILETSYQERRTTSPRQNSTYPETHSAPTQLKINKKLKQR